MPPNVPVRAVTSRRIGTDAVQSASVARKLMTRISNVYINPFAMPKYHPLRCARRADAKPPAKDEKPWIPNTHGSMFVSSTDDPVSIMERTTAPIASHMHDQYKPEATGEAIRKPSAPVRDFTA